MYVVYPKHVDQVKKLYTSRIGLREDRSEGPRTEADLDGPSRKIIESLPLFMSSVEKEFGVLIYEGVSCGKSEAFP